MVAVLDRNSYFYYFLLLLMIVPIFADLGNGYLIFMTNTDFSIGVLFRGVIIVLCAPLFLYITERIFQVFMFTLLFLWIIFNLIWASTIDYYSASFEIKYFFRTIYPYFVLFALYYVVRYFDISIERLMKYIVVMAVIAAVSLIFSFLTGIGVSTYNYGYGVSSFFKSQNSVGLSMLIALVMSMYLTLKKFNFRRLLFTLTIIFGLLLLSTRTSVIGAFGVLLIFIFIFMIYGRMEINIQRVYKIIIFIILLIVLAIAAYKFFMFFIQYGYLLNKAMNLLEGRLTRVDYSNAGLMRIESRDLVINLFGEGTVSFRKFVEFFYSGQFPDSIEGKSVEVDTIDILGSYGFILGGLFLLFPIYSLLRMIYLFFRNSNMLNLTFLICMSIFLFHSFAAGHGLQNPLVGSVVALVYFYIHKNKLVLARLNNQAVEKKPETIIE